MALEYTYDTEREIITIVGRGDVTMEERRLLVGRMMENTSLPAMASVLVDVSEITKAPEPGDLGAVGKFIEQLLARFKRRVAILNRNADHRAFSLVIRLFIPVGDDKLHVFSETSEARAWLGA
jgi:hypothetical protein